MKSSQKRTILLAANDAEVRTYFELVLQSLGYCVKLAAGGDDVLASLQSDADAIDAVLLDIGVPDAAGLELAYRLRDFHPGLPVVVVTAAPLEESVASAIKGPAVDLLCKPLTQEMLSWTLARVTDRFAAPCASPSATRRAASAVFFGDSPAIRKIQALADRIARSEAPVLIQGETGTGKEILARDLHARSPRARKPFLKVNCAALPSELIESELFGYERGAFTGAHQRTTGMFERADGGTLLLDEIGDMDCRLQSKLLHVLQDSSFFRVGGKETVTVDVRVMAATHCNLEQRIAHRDFREDLYYRLNVISVELPPLRDRADDILALGGFLIRKHVAPDAAAPPLTDGLKQALLTYRWPGNIRELENCIRRLLIFKDPEALAAELRAKSDRPGIAPELPASRPALSAVFETAQQFETDAILSALNRTGWNRRRAAVLLQISYSGLRSRMKKLGIGSKSDSADGTSAAFTHAGGSIQ